MAFTNVGGFGTYYTGGSNTALTTAAALDLVEIDEYEYKQLKLLNLKSAEEIIDEYTLLLFEGGLL